MTSRYAPQADRTPVLDRSLFDGILRENRALTGRLDAYLSPATVQSHAAYLAHLADGSLGLVWFGGTQEGVGDISIHFSRLDEGATAWTAPVPLTDDQTRSEQNPILFPTPSGALWLLYTAQLAGNQDTAEVRRRISTDDGRTWGDVETLFPATERGGVFVRQPVHVTPSGRWLLPIFACVSTAGARWSGDHDFSAVMISDDEGASWREVPVPGSDGCVHMNIVSSGGVLVALFRSRWADSVYRSESADDGLTWSVPEPTNLPNNNSSVQQVALADGRLALVYNHASRADATERRENLYDEIDDDGLADDADPRIAAPTDPDARTAFWGAPRAPMTLAVSSDSGRTFEVVLDLDEGDGYCMTNNSRDGLNREFSYPSIVEGPDGTIDIAYTYFRQTIKHVRLAPSILAGRS